MPKKRKIKTEQTNSASEAASAAESSAPILLNQEEREKIKLFLSDQANAEFDKKFLSENTQLWERVLEMLSPRRAFDRDSLLLGLEFLERLVIKGLREELLPKIAEPEKVFAFLTLLNQNSKAVDDVGKKIANLSLAFLTELVAEHHNSKEWCDKILSGETILQDMLSLLDRDYQDKDVKSSKDLIAQHEIFFFLSKLVMTHKENPSAKILNSVLNHPNIALKVVTLLNCAFESKEGDTEDAKTNKSIISSASGFLALLMTISPEVNQSLDKESKVYKNIIPNFINSLRYYCDLKDDINGDISANLVLLFACFDPELLPQIVDNLDITSKTLLGQILKQKSLLINLTQMEAKIFHQGLSIDAKVGLLSFVASLASDDVFYQSLKANGNLVDSLKTMLEFKEKREILKETIVDEKTGKILEKPSGDREYATEGLEAWLLQPKSLLQILQENPNPHLPKLISLLQEPRDLQPSSAAQLAGAQAQKPQHK